ncbi:Predicted arabinose efflux permease, MFS family [Micromonospora inositola]|uniref:Predicted arabinose efflux permease, MFS family n=2 Tax=Micromonospora inositola TaxID=47865 RepID=A0A1C5JQ85_9ACTN|nr:Predicted arabinose efflux permease, MFS family [Micromonospora inositola]
MTAVREELPTSQGRSTRGLVPTLIFMGIVVAVVSSLGAPLIPKIATADGVSVTDAQWALTITLLVGAVATPIMGRLGDGPARRTVMLAGLVLVTAGSALAALPTGFATLLVGRGLQGAGLGLTPLTIATARDSLPPHRARPTMAMLSITTVAGVGLGYPVTGLIAEYGGLHLAYWFGALVSLVALLTAGWIVPSSCHLPRARLDVPGAVLLGAGLAALILWISEGDAWGWFSPRSVVAIVVAVVATAAWAGYEVRHQRPLVDLRLLRHRGVLAADVTAVLAGLGMYLLISLVVQFVQTPVGTAGGLGGSVVVAGLVLLPFSAGSFAASRITPALVSRGGGRLLIPAASALALAGTMLFGLLRHNIGELVVVMAVVGLAVGTVFAVMPGMITRAVPAQETGSAMSFNQVLRYVGYSTGSALSAAMLAAHTADGHRYPSASGYTVAAFLGVALWLMSLAAGVLLPTRHRQPAGQTVDEQLLADERIADALPDDERNADRTAALPR